MIPIINRWEKNVWKIKTFEYFFSAIGFFLLFIQFSNEWLKDYVQIIKFYLSLNSTILLSFIYVLVRTFPKTNFEYQLKGRDVTIALKIGDCFKNDGSLIIPINSEFNVGLSGNVQKSASIQSNLISQYYDGKITHLEKDIKDVTNNKLNKIYFKSKYKNNKYLIGTVIEIRQKEKTFFLLANSVKKKNSHVYIDINIFTESLNELWNFLSKETSKQKIVTIPLLGTGMAGLTLTKNEVIKEIIKSFVASCSEKTYCEKLIISINPDDIDNGLVQPEEIIDFLRLKCEYTKFDLYENKINGKPD